MMALMMHRKKLLRREAILKEAAEVRRELQLLAIKLVHLQIYSSLPTRVKLHRVAIPSRDQHPSCIRR